MSEPPAAPAPTRPVRRNGVLHADLCVIGAGAAGLSLAAGAVRMGASVVLVEKHLMGGDCLNSGCVPSKALLAAAHAAAGARRAARFGIAAEPAVDFAAVMAHVRRTIAAIAPHDGEERFRGLGVEVIRAAARFTAPDMVEAGGKRIRARRFAVATGSRPAIPPLPGLDTLPCLTNETVFGLNELPRHLIVLGGGPVGVEMAQAFRRLGAEVTLVERARLLPRDEPEAASALRAALAADGVVLREGAEAIAARADPAGIALDIAGQPPVVGSHLLVAAGRRPDIEELVLDAAGIAATPQGIVVDARLRTTNRRVFAIGDVTGGPLFTHVAGAHAAVALQNILFGIPARFDAAALPWVTYTEPEIAQVGLTEAAARAAGHDVDAVMVPLSGNDRAVAEDATEGFAKLVIGARGRLLGGTLVAPHAGEAIGMLGLAIGRRLGAAALARALLPYPTVAEAVKRAAGEHFAPSLFGARTRLLVRLLQRLLP
ncbi:MAG: FAD-dependent oxidoreductase [Acetobacteraceae bacterium]|nr:FAD-dependent oxidoreductase [Acetobacteraceae bacterium]MDW8397525.1 FAD-dependent oxidoreductase [Acetobacteraceae bacterium]